MPLGRLATAVAQLIRGKHKPTFTPHMDTGDFVIVINAAKVKLTGRKLEQKTLLPSHRLHGPRAVHRRSQNMLAKHPERVIEKAVFGMLPKNVARPAELRAQAQGLRRAPSIRTPRSSRRRSTVTHREERSA